ncbi:MAG: DUF1611 domain-containing protein [Coleofasciculaceae cyanobacterium SM2_1_6]|nr:DUF1611 domain-containing protein [Coleofasciculaceae cyanobacterium SM2_1_6]
MNKINTDHKIALLLHGGIKGDRGKTGLSLLRYSPCQTVVVVDRDAVGESLAELTGIKTGVNSQAPIVESVAAALAYQPDILVIGIAPSGGAFPEAWQPELKEAIAGGLSLVNGLHTPLAQDPELAALLQPGQWIWDVRREPENLAIGRGQAQYLSCRRILTVGTDMAIGKMSTSLELHKTAQSRGLKSKFLATGQAGIMIAGTGIALDAVRVDFAAGAVEQLVLQEGAGQDVIMIEGQGSLLHPGSTATLPLLRGSQATDMILVHRWGQERIKDHPDFMIPPLPEVIKLYETVAMGAKVKAIALNTALLDELTALEVIAYTQAATGLPCTDAVRFGADILLDAAMADTASSEMAMLDY